MYAQAPALDLRFFTLEKMPRSRRRRFKNPFVTSVLCLYAAAASFAVSGLAASVMLAVECCSR